jgi:hypothetical protein
MCGSCVTIDIYIKLYIEINGIVNMYSMFLYILNIINSAHLSLSNISLKLYIIVDLSNR